MSKRPNLTVAIVHDWLVGGGAERVTAELHAMFPDAPIYTSYCTPEWRKRLDNKVVTGYLQHLGAIRKFLPLLRMWWFSNLDLSAYDIVISVSGNGEAKGVRTPSTTLHINYCHTPTHFYWSKYNEYVTHPGFGFFDPLARLGLRLLVGPLRKWDYRAAQRADVIVANSTHIKADIKKYYGREAIVVFPPVDLSRFQSKTTKRHGFVALGRQTPYKRIDLAVAACTQLGLPLTVIGQGPEHKKLVAMAGPTVVFEPNASDQQVATWLGSACALIFPQLDDFGVVGPEALAAGTPIIAFKGGGALDFVNPQTGKFFDKQTVDSLVAALKTFKPDAYDHAAIIKYAKTFDTAHFRSNMQAVIDKYIKE